MNIHWALCKKYGVKVCERWYERNVEPVIENDIVKILWDVWIQVDKQKKGLVVNSIKSFLCLKVKWKPDIEKKKQPSINNNCYDKRDNLQMIIVTTRTIIIINIQ